jgi:hypothetical protein
MGPAIVGAIVGAVVGAVLGGFLLETWKRRQAARDSTLADLKKYFVDLTSLQKWVEEEVGRRSSTRKATKAFRETVRTRRWDLYKVWDHVKGTIDSMEVVMALDQAQSVTDSTLMKIEGEEGDLPVDLAPMRDARHALKEVANRRLNARL